MSLDIAEVSKRANLPSSALRFYEQKGLISSIGRKGLRRLYAPGVLERLSLISLGRAAGFSLDEIAGMFAADDQTHINRAMLQAKSEEVEAAIAKLRAVRDGLQHAATCSAANHLECPTFRRLMRAATLGVIDTPTPPLAPSRPVKSRKRNIV